MSAYRPAVSDVLYPYDIKSFRKLLNTCKLQAPYSTFNKIYSTHYGNFKNFKTKYFYAKDKSIVFRMCGVGRRCELRFKDEWQIPVKKEKWLKLTLRLMPLNNVKEFTFIQIHSKPSKYCSVNKPLLRIAWLKGHIWAILRKNMYSHFYEKIDLGKSPEGFFSIKLGIFKNKLFIKLGKSVEKQFDVGYWEGCKNYFKLGVYLQSSGCGEIILKSASVSF
ncbi:hypothetical protein BLW93_00345 [Desulfurobacterium indicum]|uniref:Alginate lyase 2 domain-containing protein n=2 Tax=Desulfurobacterium indicum TaxID=1914305 RepID=A0A1R1MNS7_9BACT|nr:hypothetical protein BLW93_00345 [Desulfurobacterium indicum]